MNNNERTREITRASWAAIVGNALLAIMKIAAGFYSGSMAVVGDGLDSSTDIATSLITLVTASIINRPASQEFPFGHNRAETIATKVLSFVIFFVGAQLFYNSAHQLIVGELHETPTPLAVYVTLVSIGGKLLLAYLLFRTGKRIESPMIIANAKNMRNDIVISSSVLLGLVFTFYLGMPVLDLVAALLIALWIMKVAFEIFWETNLELMDGMKDSSLYDAVFRAATSIPGACNPHRTRIRRLGNMLVIDLDIEVDGNLTVHRAHDIAVEVEQRIRDTIKNVYDIMVHVEPMGNVEHDEKFGLSPDTLECREEPVEGRETDPSGQEQTPR